MKGDVRMVKDGLIKDTVKYVSNEASSPDSKLSPGIKEKCRCLTPEGDGKPKMVANSPDSN